MAPAATGTSRTRPAACARTSCSIFIASMTSSSSPGATGWPAVTATDTTVPVSGARTAAWPGGSSSRGGDGQPGAAGSAPAGTSEIALAAASSAACASTQPTSIVPSPGSRSSACSRATLVGTPAMSNSASARTARRAASSSVPPSVITLASSES